MNRSITSFLLFKCCSRGDIRAANKPVSEQIQSHFEQNEASSEIYDTHEEAQNWNNSENNGEVIDTRKQMRVKFKAWNGMSRANKYLDRFEDQGTCIVLEPIKVQKLKLNLAYIRTFLKYSADRYVELGKMDDSTMPIVASLPLEVLFKQIQFSGTKVCNFFKQIDMAGSNECTDEVNFNEVLGDLLDWIGDKVILEIMTLQSALSQSPRSFGSLSSVSLLVEFIDSLKKHLKDLQCHYNNLGCETEILGRKLVILKTICITSELKTEVERNHLLGDIQAIADRVAYVSYSGLVAQFDGDMISRMSYRLFELLAKEGSIIVETSGSDLMEPVMDDIVDSILRKMEEIKKHKVEHLMITIKDELLLVRYFLVDMANEYDELMKLKSLFYNAKVEIFKDLCSVCGSDLSTESITETLCSIKLLIRHIYHQVPKPSLTNFSNTFELVSFDFFLENLKVLLSSRLSSILFLKPQQIETLEDLVVLRSFLNEIHHRGNLNQGLQDLQVQILSVAFQMEYIMDGFAGKFHVWHKVLWFNDVMKEVINIRSKVGALSGHDIFHIGGSNAGNISSHGTSVANSLRSDEEMIGFKDEEDKILEQLVSGSRHMKLLSIVGMPGLGKTTLAKKVYNNPIISDCFYVRAWCCISKVREEEELLVEILKQIVNSDGKETKLVDDELAAKVHKGLKGQKYLIVVDDIWESKSWVNLRRSFPDDNNGSRILFTSRSHNLSLGNNIRTHHLRPFSDDESFDLLKLKLLQRKIYCYDSSLAKKIAKKCKGLPLAVVIIAGLLPATDIHATDCEARRQWKELESSLSSFVVDDILELSYRRLPYHLKPCLLYIGAYWNNRNIPIREVLQMWIAEGFVENSDPKRSEEKARSYLMDLIHRSLIFVGERRSLGGIKACYLHDLVRDFCISKAEDEKFLHLPDIERFEENRTRISLRFAADNGRWPSIFVRSLQIKFLLVHESEKKISSLILSLKFLRILKLEACSSGSYLPLPDDIGTLIHLRYLGGCFTSIPSSISNLWNLQTLILNSTNRALYSPPEAIHLPPTLWNMVNLQHLIIGCRFLFDEMSFDGTSLLDNLQSLSTPLLSYGDHTKMVMRRCPNLRNLCCIFLNHLWDSSARCARFPVLDFLDQVESLKVSYGGVDKLNSFPQCDFSLPSSLKKLTLSKFCLSWNEISIFGKLPNLEVLKLLDDAFVGEEWNTVDEEFLKLKYLKLEDLEIETWNVSYDHFPLLERLVIKKCYYLKEVPSSFGEIYTLRIIELFQPDSELKESAHLIKEEQQDMGNEDLVVLIH